ncbi:hypothetical protein KEG38_32170 [Polyangium jinanense]|uniref:hypothetical protein n=1 Tax=Polyangium jinanense TaxID=2829994 RepID=UPI0023426FC1|nr:hypothetical protein [Polyangium jinanense]MDC3958556.1 hypothetical protein [Polyangium jinanense]
MKKKEPDDELDGTPPSAEQEAEDYGGHPLFPRPETESGPDLRRFDIIQLHRWYGPKNEYYERCPRDFLGSELRNLEQIVEMFGGQCTYQAVAKCSKTHRYQAHSEKWYVDGPPRKPFYEEARRTPPTQPDPNAPHGQGPWGQPPGAPPWGPHAGPYPGYPPHYYPPPPPAPPPPQQQSMDILGLMQLLLDRDAKTRAAEVQARAQVEVAQLQYQQSLLKLATERPNGLEQAREIFEFTKSVQPPTPREDSGPWKEAFEAMKDAKVQGGGENGDELSLTTLAPILTSLVDLVKSKRAEPQAPQPPPPQPAPAPQPAPPPSVFDPATGAVYVFVPGIGHCRVVDPATAQAAQQQPVAPPAQPFTPSPKPFAQPAPQQPFAQPAPQQPFAQPASQQPFAQPPRPQPAAQQAPPVPYPQPQPVAQPQPAAPPAYLQAQPVVQQAPPLAYSPPQPAAHPVNDTYPPPPVTTQAPSPPFVPRGLQPWGRVGETAGAASDDPSQLLSTALASIPNGLPPDFEQTVREAMNSPIAQSITSHPKFKSIHDAASKGELTAEEAQEQALTFLKRAVGGDS